MRQLELLPLLLLRLQVEVLLLHQKQLPPRDRRGGSHPYHPPWEVPDYHRQEQLRLLHELLLKQLLFRPHLHLHLSRARLEIRYQLHFHLQLSGQEHHFLRQLVLVLQ